MVAGDAMRPGGAVGIELFGWVAAATSGARAFPQLRRLRTSSQGVSVLAVAFTAVTAAGWFLWAVALELWPVAASSLLTAVGFGFVWFRLRAVPHGRSTWLVLAGWGVVVVAAVWWGVVSGEWALLGWVGAAGSAVQFIPQAVRTLQRVDLSGVSSGTYVLSLANELLWLGYALVTLSAPLAAPYLLRAPVSATILVQTGRHRRRAASGA